MIGKVASSPKEGTKDLYLFKMNKAVRSPTLLLVLILSAGVMVEQANVDQLDINMIGTGDIVGDVSSSLVVNRASRYKRAEHEQEDIMYEKEYQLNQCK